MGVARWPVTGRRRGRVLSITAASWTAGFQWWRSGDITRTHNVSEYMLVLALYLVDRKFDVGDYVSSVTPHSKTSNRHSGGVMTTGEK